MHRRLTRILACFASFSLIAPLGHAAEPAPPPLPEPPVIEAARAVTQAPAPRADSSRPDPWEREDTIAHVSLAIGGAGFLAAAASLLLKKHTGGSDPCRAGVCQPRSREEITRDKALGQMTAIGTVVGIAGGVTGALLLLLPKKKYRNRKGVSAVAEPSRIGIKVRF